MEDPEELDTRFSKFAPSVHEDTVDDVLDSIAEGADDVLDLFKKIQNKHALPDNSKSEEASSQNSPDIEAARRSFKNALQKKLEDTASAMELTKIYSFHSLHEVTEAAHILSQCYEGVNSLYNAGENGYILVLSKSGHTPAEFNTVCNILSEYGSPSRSVPASEAYLEEHYEPVIKDSALQSLSCI